jgi:hypothetical protein
MRVIPDDEPSRTGRLRGRIVGLGVVLAMLCWCSLAASAATPLSPDSGETTNSHPVFTWTLEPDEESDTLYVASRPDTTPDGRFHSENVVMTGADFQSNSTAWSPAEPLYAGRHWWNVETRDAAFAAEYSAVREFTVATEIRFLSVRLARYAVNRQVTADLHWVTNSREVAVEVRFLRKGRLVGVVRRSAETMSSREPDQAALTWRIPRRIQRGTRLLAVVRLAGTGQSATVRRWFKAQ